MNLLVMIFRKIIKNYWLVISLFIGILITVSLVATIPVYTTGALQNMIIDESESYQKDYDSYPGLVTQHMDWSSLSSGQDPSELLSETKDLNDDLLDRYINMPLEERGAMLTTIPMQGERTDEDDSTEELSKVQLRSLEGLEENVEITEGREAANDDNSDELEVYVRDDALVDMDVFLGEDIRLTSRSLDEDIVVRPVGTFQAKKDTALSWPESPEEFSNMFVLPNDAFHEHVLPIDGIVDDALLYSNYDYHELAAGDISNLLTLKRHLRLATMKETDLNDVEVDSPLLSSAAKYLKQENAFRKVTVSFFIPILMMLLIYLFMISRLIVNREQQEIAVLRSRGAGRRQISFIYLVEMALLCGTAFLIGPFLGLGMSKLLGSSNGFMELVERTSLPASITWDAFLYAGIAALVCFVGVMTPVVLKTRENIVSEKKQYARGGHKPFWHKYYLDIILFAISGYGWYTLRQGQAGSGSSERLSADPLLLLVPAIFVIGLTLLCFRLYPWLVTFIAWIGRKIWPVHLHIPLMQIGRSSGQYQFFMLFLVMAISIGLFSANTARTVNQNLEEQVRYEAGSDLVMQQYWDRDIPPELTQAGEDMDDEEKKEDARILYYEPDHSQIEEWDGVDHLSRVFQKSDVNAKNPADSGNKEETSLMGIDTDTFGETASFRSSLLSSDHHWYEYLNMMAEQPNAVFLSTELADDLDVHPGEYVSLDWDMSERAFFVVYGVIDYWPSWDPEEDPYFAVGNLPYIQGAMAVEPYDLWLSLDDKADRSEMISKMDNDDLELTDFHDVQDELKTLHNDAYLTGLNGSLTLGFLIALVITFIGFLLYWILSLRSRTLQYGTFRAMGITVRQLFGMLVWEQFLTSGIAVLMGVWIGNLASYLFIPFFQQSLGSEGQLLPFHVVFKLTDELLIYIFAGSLLLIGLLILTWMVARINMHKALKLGEE